MRIIVADGAEHGAAGAAIVRAAVDDGSVRVLGVATGSSPLPLYRSLAADPPRRIHSVEFFALDEYVGVAADHPQSYRRFLERELLEPLGVAPERLHVPDGLAPDAQAESERYEHAIRDAGGVDLQIVGIGSNGHIGFNEPGSARDSRTRRARLSDRTRADNARFFPTPADVPEFCLTQGIGTILEARRILLVASGASKADALARAIEGPPDPSIPASFLHDHPDVTLVLDSPAASRLSIEGAQP